MKISADSYVKNQGSYFSLVIAVAKRAREIVEKGEDSDKEHTEKAVKMAENEFDNGKFRVLY